MDSKSTSKILSRGLVRRNPLFFKKSTKIAGTSTLLDIFVNLLAQKRVAYSNRILFVVQEIFSWDHDEIIDRVRKIYPQVDAASKTAILDRVFSPSTPVTSQDFFCGRCSELSFIRSSINEPGRHILIYGDRGVGKSSLANMIVHGTKVKVTCRKDSTFSSLWHEVLQEIQFPGEKLAELSAPVSIFDVASYLKKIRTQEKILIVFDEFDILNDRAIASEFASAIKFLSDNLPHVCLVFVGIADDAEDLISFHRSLERCLLKIPLDPMDRKEVLDILDKGLLEVSLKCEPHVREAIVRIASGYPYCVHLLSKYSFLDAIQKRYSIITRANFLYATEIASLQIYQSIKHVYTIATKSSKQSPDLYKNILLCCAISSKKFFSAEDLLYSIRMFTNLSITFRSCSSYLSKLCHPSRGSVLKKFKNNSRLEYYICDPFLKTYLTLIAYQKGHLNMGISHSS